MYFSFQASTNPVEKFTSVPLEDVNMVKVDFKGQKKKVPRRIIHFSDGVMEEYSSDEDEVEVQKEPPVDPVGGLSSIIIALSLVLI